MKHILYILDRFPNPTETFIRNEIELLIQLNDVKIAVLSFSGKPGNEKLNLIYEVEYIKWNNIGPFLKSIKYILTENKSILCNSSTNWCHLGSFLKGLKLFKKLYIAFCINELSKHRRIDHIHAHFASYPTDIAIIAADVLSIPFSFSAHAQDIYTQPQHMLRKKIEKAQFVVTCTRYNVKYLTAICNNNNLKNKIHCIYHGIDASKWKYIPTLGCANEKTINLLSVARLVEKKGLYHLICAVQILIQENYKITCTIIGEGSLRDELETYIKEKNLVQSVTILGSISQNKIKDYLYQSHIFVLPSIIATNGDRDGLPNVLLEALATGTPVVTTAVSAIPELIKHEKTGIFVPEKNPDEIARAIIKLANAPEFYQEQIIKGREIIEQEFNAHSLHIKLSKIFESNPPLI